MASYRRKHTHRCVCGHNWCRLPVGMGPSPGISAAPLVQIAYSAFHSYGPFDAHHLLRRRSRHTGVPAFSLPRNDAVASDWLRSVNPGLFADRGELRAILRGSKRQNRNARLHHLHWPVGYL